MANYDTKVPANVGTASDATTGNSGLTGKYYNFQYFIPGTPAAATAMPIGVAPVACRYVGTSVSLAAATAGTTSITVTPLKIPYDVASTTVALNSTNTLFGTTVAGYPAFSQVINFDNEAGTATKGSNNTTTTTGITDAILKTDSTVQFRQGDYIGITTSGTFTGATGLCVTVWLKEQNGTY